MLGEKIRSFRKEKNITLQELADKTGLSIGYISQIERNLVDPSLSSLRKISKSLDVPAYILFDQEKSSDNLTIKGDDVLIMKQPNSTVEYQILSYLPDNDFTPQSVAIGFVHRPKCCDSEFHIIHESEEIVLLNEGELLIHLPDESIRLSPGDSTIIKSNVPHVIENLSTYLAKGVLIFTPAIWTPFKKYKKQIKNPQSNDWGIIFILFFEIKLYENIIHLILLLKPVPFS